MKSIVSAAAYSSGSWSWRSPLPYLFGGLGAMVALITVALVVLVCSRRKSSSGERGTHLPGTADKKAALCPLDMEPRIVVIMAGDDIPTFLAKPLPVATSSSFQQQHV